MKANRWLFGGLWLLSLIAITYFGGAVSYGFFFGMTLLPVVCLLYIVCVYFRFKIYQEIGSRTTVCGRQERYFFVLKNEDFFAFTGVSIRLFSDFSYVEELPPDTEYELLPGDEYTFETRLVCRYRGEYEVGVEKVVVTDFMRLFSVSYANPGTIKALVSPKVVRLTELKSAVDVQALLRRDAFAAAEADVVVREYAEGDPPKQIHWKATARAGRLMTRVRTGEEKQGISLFCDMTRYDRDSRVYLPLENKMLEVLLALGFFFAGRDISFCAYYGQDGPVRDEVQGMRDFEDFYAKISGVTFREKEDCRGRLEGIMAGGAFRDSRAVFLVLHELDSAVMETTRQLAAGGMPVVIYVVTDRVPEEDIRQGSERWRIVQVPIEAELEEIL